ncbi:MAG: T9SS type A sorting domain-containing protein [Bacteroidetes bacterium]|nr:T9SS type A sorting domain-containing protein [Bacteroidota bacterium]
MIKLSILFKSAISVCAILLASFNANSQSLSPAVIASTGSYGTSTNVILTSTTGDLVIATGSQSTAIVTQGFIQPLNVTSSIREQVSGLELTSYPNPALTELTVRIEAPGKYDLQIHVVDMLGRHINIPYQLDKTNGLHEYVLDLKDISPGLYLIRFISNEGEQTKSIKINKI